MPGMSPDTLAEFLKVLTILCAYAMLVFVSHEEDDD